MYLTLESGPMDVTETTNHTSTVARSVSNTVDEVDEQLMKLDGKLQRKRDEKL